jgi:hypothetical protein
MSSCQNDLVGTTSPLDDAGILLHVLSTLGPGHHLFISPVSKAWRESYERVASVQIAGITYLFEYGEQATLHLVTSQTTLCSAAFASASRVNLAYERGMPFGSRKLQCIAGRDADIPTLQALHELGLQLTDGVLIGAAEAASVPKLQWLRNEQGCALPDDISFYAARSGSLDTLR